MSDDPWDRWTSGDDGAGGRECPICGARPGQQCSDRDGVERGSVVHEDRDREDWEIVVVPIDRGSPEEVLLAVRSYLEQWCDAPSTRYDGNSGTIELISDLRTLLDRARVPLTRAELDVLAERRKQRRKWGHTHDLGEHDDGDLADAAAELLLDSDRDAQSVSRSRWATMIREDTENDRRRRLVIGAALALAEIDRLDRKESGDR